MGFSLFCSVPLSCSASVSHSPSCIENGNAKYIAPKSSDNMPSVVTLKRFSRRLILHFVGLSSIWHAYPILAAPIMPEMKEPEVLRTFKLDSGVRIQDIVEGEGPEARGGDLVEFNYVCRRANGYFVYSTVDQFSGESKPVILPLDENQMIEGLKEVLTGMRVGGKRRALLPPSVGYVNENLKPVPEEVRYGVDKFGPRRSLFSHAKEPLLFEVQLLKNLSLPSPSVF